MYAHKFVSRTQLLSSQTFQKRSDHDHWDNEQALRQSGQVRVHDLLELVQLFFSYITNSIFFIKWEADKYADQYQQVKGDIHGSEYPPVDLLFSFDLLLRQFVILDE